MWTAVLIVLAVGALFLAVCVIPGMATFWMPCEKCGKRDVRHEGMCVYRCRACGYRFTAY